MPVSSTSAPIDTRLKGSTPARTTTTRRFISKPSAQNSSDSSLVKDVDEEFDNVIDIEEEVLRPVITRKYALHSPCSGHSIRMMGTKSNIIKADADSHSSYGKCESYDFFWTDFERRTSTKYGALLESPILNRIDWTGHEKYTDRHTERHTHRRSVKESR